MTSTVPSQKHQTEPIIRRTERGLSVSGSRITLYDVMDYYGKELDQYDGDPLGYVRYALPALSEEEIQAAGDYIEANRDEVETEYQTVLKEAAEREKYWRARAQEWRAKIASKPITPERAALMERVEAHEAQLEKMREANESAD